MLIEFQSELNVNYCNLVSVAVQSPDIQAAFRAGLGANWHFLCDTDRKVIRQIGILDNTEGEYADVSRPFTFVLKPDLTIHSIYDGWYFVGRPTLDELRHDLRDIMRQMSYYSYAAWDTDTVKKIRIPQAHWRDGIYDDKNVIQRGTIDSFNIQSGNGTIRVDNSDEIIFFNFTAIPGEGYRTLRTGTAVKFEVVENPTGRTARNIQTM